MELVIYDLLNNVIHDIADSDGKEKSSMLDWMRFSVDVMRTMNGTNEHVKEHYQVIFPAEMLLKHLKNEYNIDSNTDKIQPIIVKENNKSILKKDNQYPAKTVTFTDTVTFQEAPTYDLDHNEGSEKTVTDKTETNVDDNNENGTNVDKDSENNDTLEDDKNDNTTRNGDVTDVSKRPEEEDASFGNITFMDDRGEYFANFFSDI